MKVFTTTELWQQYSKYFFGGLFLIAFVSGLLYVYFLNLAVFKTAEKNDNWAKLSVIKGQLQNLEIVYISKLDEMDLSYARSLGFVEAEPVSYIYRQRTVAQGYDYGQQFR